MLEGKVTFQCSDSLENWFLDEKYFEDYIFPFLLRFVILVVVPIHLFLYM
jgi:hypothetical protein